MLSQLSGSQVTWITLGVIAALYFGWQALMGVFKAREKERSRREAMAYVAEGTMNAETAERLLNAPMHRYGEDDETIPGIACTDPDSRAAIAEEFEATKREALKQVATKALSAEDAERLLRLCTSSILQDVGDDKDSVLARVQSEQETYREALRRVGEKKVSVEDAERMLKAGKALSMV
ncbi:MAG: hypothetical protein IBJ11_02315 [Phycisphaerales bacterium]|nr:hypothetical protein [Phycisphaerales bacterium]